MSTPRALLPSIPGFQSANRLPRATVWRGPGTRLRNVNAAARPQRLQARLTPSLRGHGRRRIGHDGRPYPPVLGGPAARWRSETRAWHEELLAVVRLPDAAARRPCEATLRTDRLVTPMTTAVPRVIRARTSRI